MEKVFIKNCYDYDENVEKIVKEIFQEFEMEKIIVKDSLVVLKVNLVCGAEPEKACTTHPSIVKAVAKECVNLGAKKVIIADSPGGPFSQNHLKGVYEKSKMTQVVCQDVELNSNFNIAKIENKENKFLKNFNIISVLNSADVIINISKFKTHTFMGYTGVVKNMFGAIPGLEKVEMHSRFVSQTDFGNMLIDINETLKSKMALNVLDSVLGMQGQGPTGGKPIKINKIMASNNAYALDYVQMEMMTENLSDFPIYNCFQERKVINKEEIVICGDYNQIPERVKMDVPEVSSVGGLTQIPNFIKPLFNLLMTRRPIIKKNRCKGCGKCFQHCPAKAITMIKKKNKRYAKVNYKKCIRCFCCQELCPFNIVKIKSGIINKFLHFKIKKD